jgi:hypothetical protein
MVDYMGKNDNFIIYILQKFQLILIISNPAYWYQIGMLSIYLDSFTYDLFNLISGFYFKKTISYNE